MASVAVVLAVGARLRGQASSATLTSRCALAERARFDLGLPVTAINGTPLAGVTNPQQLMDQLKKIAETLQPTEILFVADAMTGQDAVKSAEEFGKALPLTGAILTKMDGDSRGGAALSIRSVTQVPLRYVGIGEKLEEFDLFHPDRLTSRILGMGDVLSLIEKAEQGLDANESKRLAERLVNQQFTLEDLRDQLRQIRRLGPLSQLMDLMPKIGPLRDMGNVKVDDKELKRIEAIINSMTPLERTKPQVLNGKRKVRIARGSGTQVQDINRLLKQYQMMQKLMKGTQGKFLKKMGMR